MLLIANIYVRFERLGRKVVLYVDVIKYSEKVLVLYKKE